MPPSTRSQGQQDARNVRSFGQHQPQPNQAGQPAEPLDGPEQATLEFINISNNVANIETRRYQVLHLIGKGSYGVVCAARDLQSKTKEVVAIKKIQNVFENVADAHRILREITLLRVLKHPDIVEVKHIMLPSDPNKFKDLYVVFELMESDLHTVIGANDDLTRDHHKVFLYQLLRGLNFMHTNKVLHRDLKPKNILANSNCKLKICDFGLARPCMGRGASSQSPVIWTDYVATRWYRAPELCGCFYGQYNGAVDMWSVGCIFAEVLQGKPLFPAKDAAGQLSMITDLLGKPPNHVINIIPNEKARVWLADLKDKPAKNLEEVFPNADPAALDLLSLMLAFDPADRPTPAAALAHPYFAALPSAVVQAQVPVIENFPFEQADKLTEAGVRQLIYEEVLNYHPTVREAYERRKTAYMRRQQEEDDLDNAMDGGDFGGPSAGGSGANGSNPGGSGPSGSHPGGGASGSSGPSGSGGSSLGMMGRIPVPLEEYDLATSAHTDSVSLQFMFGTEGQASQESAGSLDSDITSGLTQQQMMHMMMQQQQQQAPPPPPGFGAAAAAASGYGAAPAGYGLAAAAAGYGTGVPPPAYGVPPPPGYGAGYAAQSAYGAFPVQQSQPQAMPQQNARGRTDPLSQYQEMYPYTAPSQPQAMPLQPLHPHQQLPLQQQQQHLRGQRPPQAAAAAAEPIPFYGLQPSSQQIMQQQAALYQQQQQLQAQFLLQQQLPQGTPKYEPAGGGYLANGAQYM